MEKISILIVDDHTLMRETWELLLNSNPAFTVVGLAGSGEQAIELVKELHPDIVLMDIKLPGINGIEATQVITGLSPVSKVIAVSMHEQFAYVKNIMKNGASGYVTKNSGKEELFRAILEVHNKGRYICDEVKITFSWRQQAFHSISKRENEVIEFVRKGYTSREIADQLKVTVKTVEAHRYKIMKKLNLKNVAALVNYINSNTSAVYN